MEELINSQRDLFGRISRTMENLKRLGKANITVDVIHSALPTLDERWHKFEAQHERLKAEHRDAVEKHQYTSEEVALKAELKYYEQRGQLLQIERQLKASMETTVAASKDAASKDAAVKDTAAKQCSLPRIQLPKFSGNFEEWPSFRDLFSSMVKEESSLTKVEKLHYLISCVTGEAESLLKNMPTTANNFDRAWALLVEHYENKRFLVRSFLSKFLALPKMRTDPVNDLRQIYHGVLTTVSALEGIGRPIGKTEDLFVHLITNLLDERTRSDWERLLGKSSEPPPYAALKDFLQTQLRLQEALHGISYLAPTKPASRANFTRQAARTVTTTGVNRESEDQNRNCPLCKGSHYLASCMRYRRRSPEERRQIASTHRRCLNCLGRHELRECTSNSTCFRCAGNHHTSLHDAFATSLRPGAETFTPASASASINTASPYMIEENRVMLATARVLVTDSFGADHCVRALVDPGAETSLVAESLAQRLRLPRTRASADIFGVGGQLVGTARNKLTVTLKTTNGHFELALSPFIMPRLTVYNGIPKPDQPWSHVKGLRLADPDFSRRDPVELLLSAEVYASILLPGLRKGRRREPIAQQTELGWILLGALGTGPTHGRVTALQCSHETELSQTLRRFWEWEEPEASPLPFTPDEEECERQFVQTHSRLPNGRFQVRLPLRTPLPNLADTRAAASRMLEATERRFKRDDAFRKLYSSFMHEYEELQHMSPVSAHSMHRSGLTCFLPHHGVVKQSDGNLKIRVVFNGSARTSAGASLNDALRVGPNLLPPLPDVVLRWRCHRYAFVADVEKMYRQIMVHPDDRNLQQILWRKGEKVVEYCLNTVTYGLASAPFLAIRSLHQLAREEAERFPAGARALQEDTYVDDVLSGAPSLEKGLRWNQIDDTMSVTLSLCTDLPPTKRTVLSQVARLFDPLGWLAPVVIKCKILIQTTWLQQLDWDVPLAPEESKAWTRIQAELPLLERVRIPRWFCGMDQSAPIEVHGFADASERAYAAVVYVRTVFNDETHVFLAQAKTKVAPLKRISLPRLELCAAALLSKVCAHVKAALRLETATTFHWSDSTVALAWIRSHPAKWTTFVANRVAEIQRLSSGVQWRHISGQVNPADCASRGLHPIELVDHPLWWQGPPFLKEESRLWPVSDHLCTADAVPEQRISHCLLVKQHAKTSEEPSELSRFSSLSRLLRVTSWIRRWLPRRRGDRTPHSSIPLTLSPDELDDALFHWVKLVQGLEYDKELKELAAGRIVPRSSELLRLTPLLDDRGVLRVGGRLRHSLLTEEQCHPAILPPRSHLTALMIEAVHRRTLHGGTQATLAAIRRRFWIPRGRQLVKSTIRRCSACSRWRAATPQPPMGDLPASRVTPGRPFLHTGVDFAGPVQLRTARGRGHKAYKGFLAIFICFRTRAVHLEAVSDYSSAAFLAAFRRFVSRRGLCEVMQSDCGTNFVGADSELRALFRKASPEVKIIAGQLAERGVKWIFNPPAAPHFGGLWEAAVKSVKFHLRRVIGDATLTFEEMSTLLAEVEACLNSRPLQAMSDDPSDLSVLTPGHFLIGAPLLSVPERSLADISGTHLTRWRLLQQMRDHIWQRWSAEYLQSLTPRGKWWKARGGLKVGDICLVKNEATSPTRWPLARVLRVHHGQDGHVRVVDVRTAKGELTRPVVKLVPLTSEDATS